MCGIAGLVDITGREVRKDTVAAMTNAIKHRGPDGEGQWVKENVGLGHRRLAIIDLTNAAAQPMTSKDSRYVLTYNGEIYNYREIRKELESLGYEFLSQSDSEVLLSALIHWREKALIKFNGMFAFAFYDIHERKMLLARDRYGIKPLYYSLQNSLFAFGSEQKAIKSRSSFKTILDKEALLEYMTFQNIFTDKTLERDIKLLPAGHYMYLDTKRSHELSPVQYWDFHFTEPDKPESEQEYREELNRLFSQAVKRTLISDVEVGSYLSGGIDSASISAIASNENHDLKTFTVGFDLSTASGIEMGFDERDKARALAGQFKTQHFDIVLKPGDMENSLKQLVWHLEEPRVGQSYPNLFAANLASQHVKVVLSGSGGDELFGGYPWRYYRTSGSKSFHEYVDSYYLYWQRLIDNKSLREMFSPISQDVSRVWTRDIFENVFKTHSNELRSEQDYINHSLYFEAKTFLQGLFVVEDKLSMAFGLETRVPFMDNDLVDFAMQLPVNLKVREPSRNFTLNENEQTNKVEKYHQINNDGKYLLRKAMSKNLPLDLLKNPKQGFSAPDASWFRGESMAFVNKVLTNRENKLYNLFEYDRTRAVLQEHFDGKQNRRLLIWSLLSLSTYLDINEDFK